MKHNLILSLKRYIVVKTKKITSKSIGRILSKKLIILCDNPPVDISSMDGYAIKKEIAIKKNLKKLMNHLLVLLAKKY